MLTPIDWVIVKLLTGFEPMPRPVGGRGKQAPYKSTHVRIPEPIKAEVEKLVERFHSGGDLETENTLTGLDEAVTVAKGILAQKKSARISMEKLLTAIYGENVRL